MSAHHGMNDRLPGSSTEKTSLSGRTVVTSRGAQDVTSRMTSASPFAHPAFFYRGEHEYVSALVPFIRAGAEAGEPVAVAVPNANLQLIRAELRNLDPNPAGPVRFVDMSLAGRNPGRIIPKVLLAFADAHRSGHVRIVGEPIWAGRTPREYPACVQHEALINAAFHGRDATVLCPYDVERLRPEALTDARVTHPAVIENGREQASSLFSPSGALAHCNEPLTHPADAAAFEFDGGRLHDARLFAVRLASRLGTTDEGRAGLSLIVAELTTNSVVHAGGSGTLRLWAEGDQLVCEV